MERIHIIHLNHHSRRNPFELNLGCVASLFAGENRSENRLQVDNSGRSLVDGYVVLQLKEDCLG